MCTLSFSSHFKINQFLFTSSLTFPLPLITLEIRIKIPCIKITHGISRDAKWSSLQSYLTISNRWSFACLKVYIESSMTPKFKLIRHLLASYILDEREILNSQIIDEISFIRMDVNGWWICFLAWTINSSRLTNKTVRAMSYCLENHMRIVTGYDLWSESQGSNTKW